jgi:hypothetical protein
MAVKLMIMKHDLEVVRAPLIQHYLHCPSGPGTSSLRSTKFLSRVRSAMENASRDNRTVSRFGPSGRLAGVGQFALALHADCDDRSTVEKR